MSVYVDKATMPYGRMKMCHMLADTIAELHTMADTIGIQRKWFQNHGSTPHYDICQSKRKLAIESGAIEIGYRGVAALIKSHRNESDKH